MTGQELLEMLISWIENKGYIVKNVNLDGGIANISSLYKLCAIDFSVATVMNLFMQNMKIREFVRMTQ